MVTEVSVDAFNLFELQGTQDSFLAGTQGSSLFSILETLTNENLARKLSEDSLNEMQRTLAAMDVRAFDAGVEAAANVVMSTAGGNAEKKAHMVEAALQARAAGAALAEQSAPAVASSVPEASSDSEVILSNLQAIASRLSSI